MQRPQIEDPVLDNSHLDARDQEILAISVEAMNAYDGFRVGDWVDFADGVSRRISYIWPDGPQTSNGGTYHLGLSGYVSMSGSLFVHVPGHTLSPTDDLRPGRVWFFHHNWATAHNGVEATVAFRVFHCSVDAPKS